MALVKASVMVTANLKVGGKVPGSGRELRSSRVNLMKTTGTNERTHGALDFVGSHEYHQGLQPNLYSFIL